MSGLLLPVLAVSGAVAGDWETVRDNYETALKANEKRIQEIEARERGIQDPQQRAEKITRDKVAALRAAVKGGGTGKSLAEAADKAAGDPKALADLSRDQAKYLEAATSDWGADGPERKRLRESMAATQKNLERINAGLTHATSSTASVTSLNALEKATRIEAAMTEAGDRLRARWQLEQAAREREAKQREREAAERARSSGAK
ncbi:MAG TPA: hypothetical protein VIF11_04900 [Methylomirabilota bacterium]|jgi:hypothetical protein